MSTSGIHPNTVSGERKVFPLSKLAASIASHIDSTFSGSYWITAEISKLNHYPQSGHCYPQLVEKRDGQIVAEIRAFILNNRFKAINQKFTETAGTLLADGMQIMFRCKVSYHAVYGLQLNLLDIEPGYTLGEMARMRQEAIAKLKREGIFGQNKILPTPLLIRKLAVISVETSKGWRDFAQVIERSGYPRAISTRLFPALLQGDAAVGSILSALDKVRQIHQQFDAVTIIRGGGGEVGLDCYDNYALGKAICTFPIPVITGIGHATNLTLVEQVAHKNLITPTDLARYISDGFEHFAQRIHSAKRSLAVLRKGWFELQGVKLERRRTELISVTLQRTDKEKSKLGQKTRKLGEVSKSATVKAQESLAFRLPAKLGESARGLLMNETRNLNLYSSVLGRLPKEILKDRSAQIAFLGEKVKLLDPSNALKRGYSITTHSGSIVRDAATLKNGESIETIFAKGKAESTITKTEK